MELELFQQEQSEDVEIVWGYEGIELVVNEWYNWLINAGTGKPEDKTSKSSGICEERQRKWTYEEGRESRLRILAWELRKCQRN